jgi:hypothetical protein
MSDPWFHKRVPTEGTGYSIASREGMLAGLAVVVLVTLAVVVPVTLGVGTWMIYGIAAVVLLASLIILGLLIRKHSDG